MLDRALENWRQWGLSEKPALIRVFHDGQNHHTGLIESGTKRFVLKVFNHSFSRTLEAESWASKQSISPAIQFAGNNVVVYQFVDDDGFSSNKISSLATSLRRMHQSNALEKISKASDLNQKFDLLGFCDTYLASANSSAHRWHKILMPALSEFCNDRTPLTFCHNDLVSQNCLFTHGNVLFIDWEFAQRNNPWFDLAAVILYFNLTSHQAIKLLTHYQAGKQYKAKGSIFYTSQIAVLWCDLLWNIHQSGNGYSAENASRFQQLSILAATVNIALTP